MMWIYGIICKGTFYILAMNRLGHIVFLVLPHSYVPSFHSSIIPSFTFLSLSQNCCTHSTEIWKMDVQYVSYKLYNLSSNLVPVPWFLKEMYLLNFEKKRGNSQFSFCNFWRDPYMKLIFHICRLFTRKNRSSSN